MGDLVTYNHDTGRAEPVSLVGPDGSTPLTSYVDTRELSLSEITENFVRGIEVGSGPTINSRTAYKKQAWVNRCVRLISSTIATQPWTVYRADDPQYTALPHNHPTVMLFRRPAPRKSGWDLWTASIGSYLLGGNMLWWLDFGEEMPRGARLPQRIVNLNPRRVVVLTDRNGEILGYEYTPEKGRKFVLAQEEVVHVPQYDPDSDTWGLSTLSAAMVAAQTDVLASTFNQSFFKNSAQTGGILIGSKKMNDEQRRQMRDQFEGRHRGTGNAHRLAILTGDWNYQATGLSQNDMQMIALREFGREEISTVFGVPSLYLNNEKSVNRANADVQKRIFAENGWGPIASAVQTAIQVQFFETYDPLNIGRWDLTDAPGLREDITQKIDNAEKLHTMGVPLNDIVEMLGINVSGDYDWGDKWWVQQSMVPAGSVVVTNDETVAADDNERGVVNHGHRQDADAERGTGIFTPDELREIYWRAFVKQIQPMTNTFASRMRRHVMELRQEVLSNFAAAGDAPVRQALDAQTRDPLDTWIDNVLFDLNAGNRRLRAWSGPLIDDAVVLGGNQILGDIGLDPNFSFSSSTATQFSIRRKELITGINDTIYKRLTQQLGLGLTSGETETQLAQRVKGVFNAASSRARTIARTEISAATNGGRISAMVDNGIKRHTWLSARDDHVRSGKYNHQIDGETQTIGEEFSNQLRWPNDESGEPGNVINCRCTVLAVVNR